MRNEGHSQNAGFFSQTRFLSQYSLWEEMKNKRNVISYDLELTARCNNNCRRCYINLPVNDKTDREKELSYNEIIKIADEAVSFGAFWCP